jgi:hypothetical protein
MSASPGCTPPFPTPAIVTISPAAGQHVPGPACVIFAAPPCPSLVDITVPWPTVRVSFRLDDIKWFLGGVYFVLNGKNVGIK